MRHGITKGTINYWPNRQELVPPASHSQGAFVDYPQKVSGIKTRTKSAKFKDHISQAQMFFNSLSPIEKAHAVSAFSFELDHCDDPVVYERIIQRLAEIDLSLAQTVADNVGAERPEKAAAENQGQKAPNLSQLDLLPPTPTIASRRVAILIADGFDLFTLRTLQTALEAASAVSIVIGTKRSPISPVSGAAVTPDHHLEGFRSTMVDAILIPGGRQSIMALGKNGRAVHWIREAFGHLKTIGATAEGVKLVQAALALNEVQASDSTHAVESYGVVTLGTVQDEALSRTVDLSAGGKGFVERFFASIAQHRNWARELEGLSSQVAY
jgi:catalase